MRLRTMLLPWLTLWVIVVGCSHEIESPSVTANTGVDAVAPDLVCAEQLTTKVVIHGDGFTPMPTKTLEDKALLALPSVVLQRTKALDGAAASGSVTIPDNAADPTSSRLHWDSELQMWFDVYPELKVDPGVYDIHVTNPDKVKKTVFSGGLVAVLRPAVLEARPSPDIICDAQGDQTMKLVGTGFLQWGTTYPTVQVGTQSFTAKSTADCTPVPGTFAEGTINICKSLTFVIPKGALAPTEYDVVVTNPSPAGCNSSQDAVKLRVVPPPTLTFIQPDIACDAQADQSMTLVGKDFLQIGTALPTVQVGTKTFPGQAVSGCTAIPGTFTEGAASECTSLTFSIPKGALDPGEYTVVVTNPSPAGCLSQEVVKLRIVPPAVVSTIEPDLVCDAEADQSMKLTGKDFLQVGNLLPTITLGSESFTAASAEGCTEIPGNFAEGKVMTCTALHFTIPVGKLAEGAYPVQVTNPKPADCHSIETLGLYVAAAPVIQSLDKTGICDAQADQTLTVIGSKFLKVGGKLPTVMIGTDSFTPTSAGGCTAIPGSFAEGMVEVCTSLTVAIPKDTFVTTADYPVVVTNPLPANCKSTATITLHVEEPPRVDAVAPSTVCTGGSVFKITGEGFIPTPTVELRADGQPSLVAVNAKVSPDGRQIDASMGPGALVDTTYDVVVTNPDGCEDRPLPHQKVHVVPGPLVFFVDPEVVYNGVNTRATVYATALTLPLPTQAVWIESTTVNPGAITYLEWTPVAGKPNRVQVIIPKGQVPDVYNLYLNDASGCSASLPQALRVTADLTLTLKSIEPPFGWTGSETAVTIFRDTAAAAPANKPFVATPRAFLNPTDAQATDTAIPLESVAFVDAAKLTAIVPKNQPVHQYDLIVVNPDGAVGFLSKAFAVEQLRPPTIDTVTPSSIVSAPDQVVKVTGHDLRNSVASLACNGTPVPTSAVVSATVACDGNQNCTQQVTINGAGITAGSVCVLRETNDDGSYADYSAIGVTNSSLNLSSPKAGPEMNVGRRALVAASGDATQAARFVYAIGGDDGQATPTAFDSVEAASVDLFGTIGTWQLQKNKMPTARSFAASAHIGRYIYVFGGSEGTNAVNTAIRAMILNPRETPSMDVDDLIPNAAGLDAGYFFYKLSAVFSATDPDNPGGESLPSDEFIVKVPTFPGKKIQVALKWTAPVDSLGVAVANVTGYRLYRTPTVNGTSGGEVLIKEFAGDVLSYTDDGTAVAGTDTPLPLGSTGKWTNLPAMNAARRGPAGIAAVDPSDPATVHLYSFFGLGNGGVAQATYEFLDVTLLPNGHQTVGSTWQAGSQSSGVGRWQSGAWLVDSTVTTLAGTGEQWIYLGGGALASGTTDRVEAAMVQVGGQLGAFDDTNVVDFKLKSGGYGVCAANEQLFMFGGAQMSPSPKAKSAPIVSPLPALDNNSWNDEGLTMTHGRYLLGSSVQSAFIFLLGGQTDEPSPASKTTELVVW